MKANIFIQARTLLPNKRPKPVVRRPSPPAWQKFSDWTENDFLQADGVLRQNMFQGRKQIRIQIHTRTRRLRNLSGAARRKVNPTTVPPASTLLYPQPGERAGVRPPFDRK
ncbi:hypothetical protein EVAR_100742_1 [Eumeta japonica]|uniref:Uncharacterized protein n=1 Tax=Eumeta variegata TaxID=151549 RepID=A0A4C1ZQQ5_EUMVA|nr:hypothetical protein EVAR_100742_1 [Eumeta japonica]